MKPLPLPILSAALLAAALPVTIAAQNPAPAPATAQTAPSDPSSQPPSSTPPSAAASGDLRTLLRDALFEEEATRDLTKAAAGYEALLAQWDAQRPTAAAALYRLAEVRRKQDRKADAIALYQRLLREFPDIEPHARLSKENLTALGAKEPAPASPLTPAEALRSSMIPGGADALISKEEQAALLNVHKIAGQSPDLLRGNEFANACSQGWLSVVQALVSYGVTLEPAAFSTAAERGHLAIVKELMKLKPDAAALAGAVDSAAAYNRIAVLRFLLEAGASPEGSSPEYPALNSTLGDGYAEAAELLLTHKTNPDPATAVTSPLFTAARERNVAMVKRLLELKADPNRATRRPEHADPDMVPRDMLKDPYGATPLHAAVSSGNAEVVKLLLEAKANPNAQNDAGYTPLLGAVLAENLPLTEQLLAAGADPNLASKEGRTPLCRAILLRKPDIAAALLKAKADPNALTGKEKKTSIFEYLYNIADKTERDAMLTLFLEHGADPFLPAAPSIRKAPPEWRIQLLRSHKYPALAGTTAITLVFGNEAYLSPLADRKEDTEKPGTLPLLLTAWNEKGSWNIPHGGTFVNVPDWSTLRLWRKGADGKMQETVIEVKADTQWPALQWGDVIELLAKAPETDPFAARPDPRAIDGLPPVTLELLKAAK